MEEERHEGEDWRNVGEVGEDRHEGEEEREGEEEGQRFRQAVASMRPEEVFSHRVRWQIIVNQTHHYFGCLGCILCQ